LNKVHYAAHIPTFEGKVAQRAIVMVLATIYEQDFMPCSYGFRPRRSAHEALRKLHGAISWQGQHWVLDVDIPSTSTRFRTRNFGCSSTSE